MFAARTDWELSENPLSLALADFKARGEGFLDLTESNPTRVGIRYPEDMLLRSFNNSGNLLYEPLAQGLLKARAAVAAYFAVHGVAVAPERLVLTSSSSEAYTFLFRLLADPNDEVLLPAPSYPLFAYLAGLNDVRPVYYRLTFNGDIWCLDFDSIEEAACSGKVKAIVLVSPNNPTGSFISSDELSRLNVICARYGMAIISDEVFSDYIFSSADRRFVSAASNTEVLSFALGGLSKALALPQMKLGWIAANGPASVVTEAMARLDVIADTYLSVNTPVQNACVEWLAQAEVIQSEVLSRVTGNLDVLRAAAVKDGIFLYPVEGGWYAVLRTGIAIAEDELVVRLLKEAGVYVHPGFYFDFENEGHLVLSLLPQREVFKSGVERLFKFLKQH